MNSNVKCNKCDNLVQSNRDHCSLSSFLSIRVSLNGVCAFVFLFSVSRSFFFVFLFFFFLGIMNRVKIRSENSLSAVCRPINLSRTCSIYESYEKMHAGK